jgi:hypothetical protein
MTQTIPRSNEPPSPESRLLLLSARTAIEPAAANSVSELVAGPLDWDKLISLAARNSITPLLEMHLRNAGSARVPPAVLERLSEMVRAVTAKNLLLTGELIKLAGLFRAQDVLAIPYKGPVLAAQAYGNVALREFDDLDVILRQKDMAKAHEIMISLGYRAKFPWDFSAAGAWRIPGEYNYYDAARHILVELHTEFTLRHFPVIPNLDDLSHRLIPVSLSGRELQTFSPEDALPILCIHGSKDFWERMSWVVDISEMIRSQPQLDWEKVLLLARSLRAQRMLFLGLILASDLLGAPLPFRVRALAQNDTAAPALASAIFQRLLSSDWSDLDAASRFRFRCRMLPGLAGWQYAGRLALAPAEEDWPTSRPSRALALLYMALRPLRLLRKYGWRDRRSAPPLS